MFDFLKPRTKIRPEELGIALAVGSITFKKITKSVSEYKDVPDITEAELQNLWRVLLMLHCVVISVGVKSTGITAQNEKIVLDAFWNTVADLLREQVSEDEALEFQHNTAKWYPQLRELLVDPSLGFTEAGLGPGKALLAMAMPHRDLKENVDVAIRLTLLEFTPTYAAFTKFAVDSVKKSKFAESMISYE